MTNKLAEAFDLEPLNPPKEITKRSFKEDEFDNAKEGIQEAILAGEVALQELAHIAGQTEHPRAYEVLTGLIKIVVEANKELIAIEEKKLDIAKKAKDLDGQGSGKTINNNLYVGSTAELM